MIVDLELNQFELRCLTDKNIELKSSFKLCELCELGERPPIIQAHKVSRKNVLEFERIETILEDQISI